MARVEILKNLFEEIEKKFKKEADKVFNLLYSLKENSKKGKVLGHIGKVVIKELKYKSFRFYFLADGFKLKFLGKKELENLIIKFVRMSDKKTQQKTINDIKIILRKLGEEGFG